MVSVIIVAAGASTRMEGINKQLEKLGDTPVFVMSALKYERSERVGEIIIAVPEGEESHYETLARSFGVTKLAAVTAGGETRFKSVKNALARVSENAEYIAIHDGARPLIETEEIERVIADAEKYNAAIAAAPVTDTIKKIVENGFVGETVPREKLYAAQTPQVFKKELYLSCIEKLGKSAESVTDDSSILELCGERVKITEIKCANPKITRPDDLVAASAIYDKRTVNKI